MAYKKHPFLFTAPLFMVDLRVQMIVVSLPALLAPPAAHFLADPRPMFRSPLLDQFDEFLVLLEGPGALGEHEMV